MSSPDINYPSQPSYGESLAEALKAQAEFLQGTGDFAETGSLESLLPLEESVRRKTAQTDTDVLRQTLLGTESKVEAVEDPETGEVKYGIPGATVVQDESGQQLSTGNGRYQIINDPSVDGKYTILDTNTGGTMSAQNTLDWLADKGYINNTNDRNTGGADVPSAMEAAGYGTGDTRVDADPRDLAVMSSYLQDLNGTIEAADGDVEAPAIEYTFTNPNTGEALKEGEVVRTGDGLVDLLGDKRNVQETRKLSKNEQALRLVEQNPELNALYNKIQNDNDPTNEFFGLSKTEAGRKLLDDNDGRNTLHGGKIGFDRLEWKIKHHSKTKIIYKLLSKNLDQGFPGDLNSECIFEIKNKSLIIKYQYKSNELTHVSLTNHSYWNLNKNKKETIFNHDLKINSEKYLEVNNK